MKALFFCIVFFSFLHLMAQDSAAPSQRDTLYIKPKPLKRKPKPVIITDSILKQKVDSIIVTDSLREIDSLKHLQWVADSLQHDSLMAANATIAKNSNKIDTSSYGDILYMPYLPFNARPVYMIEQEHQVQSRDELFYILAGIVLMLGCIKTAFPKYFNNIFSSFFQTSFRSRQTREQLKQNNLAGLLMNFLFVCCGGIYVALVVRKNGWISVDFWWLILYSIAILTIVYLVKFLFLRFAGWVFNTKSAADTYIFIVFLSNKILATVLVPFLLLLAFSDAAIANVAFVVSVFIILALLAYRYIVSLTTARTDLNINPLHFFLYLCTVEVLPLLLIYKAAFNYIGTSF